MSTLGWGWEAPSSRRGEVCQNTPEGPRQDGGAGVGFRTQREAESQLASRKEASSEHWWGLGWEGGVPGTTEKRQRVWQAVRMTRLKVEK